MLLVNPSCCCRKTGYAPESFDVFFQCENYLVGGLNPSEKYESQLGDDIPNIWKIWKNIKFHGSKPPTRYDRHQIFGGSNPYNRGVTLCRLSIPWDFPNGL
jgi:hypothetical protein